MKISEYGVTVIVTKPIMGHGGWGFETLIYSLPCPFKDSVECGGFYLLYPSWSTGRCDQDRAVLQRICSKTLTSETREINVT